MKNNEYKNQVCARLGLSSENMSVTQDALVRAIVMLESKKVSLTETKRDTSEKREKLTKALADMKAEQKTRAERFERLTAEYERNVTAIVEKINELNAPPTALIEKYDAEISKIEATIGSL